MLVDEAANYKAMIDALAGHLLSLVEEGPDRPIKKKHRGDPDTFGQLTPALCVSHERDLETPRYHDEPGMPGCVEFAVRIVHPSLVPTGRPDVWQGGRQHAEEVCEEAYSAWLDGLRRGFAYGMDGRVHEIVVSTVEAGDIDRVGNTRVDSRTNSILWVLKATVRVEL